MNYYAIGRPNEAVRIIIQVSDPQEVDLNCQDGEAAVVVGGRVGGVISPNGKKVIPAPVDMTFEVDKIRSKRTALLSASDWTQTLDAQISDDLRQQFAVYRQALRDITETQPNLMFDDIVWPDEPSAKSGE